MKLFLIMDKKIAFILYIVGQRSEKSDNIYIVKLETEASTWKRLVIYVHLYSNDSCAVDHILYKHFEKKASGTSSQN